MDILEHVGPAVGPQDLMSLPSLDGSPPQPSEARPWLQDGAVNFFSDILKSHCLPTRIEYNEDQTTHDCSQVEAVGELVSHLIPASRSWPKKGFVKGTVWSPYQYSPLPSE